jgi:hypothetical protein
MFHLALQHCTLLSLKNVSNSWHAYSVKLRLPGVTVIYTRWFKYDWDKLWLVYTQSVPVIFESPCTNKSTKVLSVAGSGKCQHFPLKLDRYSPLYNYIYDHDIICKDSQCNVHVYESTLYLTHFCFCHFPKMWYTVLYLSAQSMFTFHSTTNCFLFLCPTQQVRRKVKVISW